MVTSVSPQLATSVSLTALGGGGGGGGPAFGSDEEEDDGPSRLGGYSLDSDDEDEEVTRAQKSRLEIKDEKDDKEE